jgi:hypothetical protein
MVSEFFTIAHHDMIPWDYTCLLGKLGPCMALEARMPCTTIALHDTISWAYTMDGGV